MMEEYSRECLDGTDISKTLLLLGYNWNDQARRYCSTDYGLPILTEKEGYRLAQRILGLLAS